MRRLAAAALRDTLSAHGIALGADAVVPAAVAERAARGSCSSTLVDDAGVPFGRLLGPDADALEAARASLTVYPGWHDADESAWARATPTSTAAVVPRGRCTLMLIPERVPFPSSAAWVHTRAHPVASLMLEPDELASCRVGDVLLPRAGEPRAEGSPGSPVDGVLVEVFAALGGGERPASDAWAGPVVVWAGGEPAGIGRLIRVDGLDGVELVLPDQSTMV